MAGYNDIGLTKAAPPTWSYAGQLLPEDIKTTSGPDHLGFPTITLKDSTTHSTANYLILKVQNLSPKKIIEHSYLLPHYENIETSYRRRETGLLLKSKERFFEAISYRSDHPRTKTELEGELKYFDEKLLECNRYRLKHHWPELTFFESLDSLTPAERALRNHGALTVGHAVNRLMTLGQIILQGNRLGLVTEYSDDDIANNMDAIKEEFQALYMDLTLNRKILFQCIQTRSGAPDYDGTFIDMVRDMGKTLLGVLFNPDVSENETPDNETLERQGMINKIGSTIGAIDETYLDLANIVATKHFKTLKQEVMSKKRSKKNALIDGGVENYEQREHALERAQISVSNYDDMLSEFAALCRARACIRVRDQANFNAIETRLQTVCEEMELMHREFENNAQFGDKELGLTFQHSAPLTTVDLLRRGVHLMKDMAELRMPRNHAANTELHARFLEATDSEKLRAFMKEDTSSAGRLRREITHHIHELLGIERSAAQYGIGST